MTDPSTDPIKDAARTWVIRIADPDFSGWEGFSEWLEADPRHNAAYEAALAEDREIADWFVDEPAFAPPPVIVAQRAPRRVGRWGWGSGAIAAGIVAAVGVATLQSGSDPYTIETAAGEVRRIALEDGSRIDLNGGGRIILDADEPRVAVLDRGEALFTVEHDADDPFVVRAGPSHLVDLGTVFNVVRSGGATRMAVAEGAVVYNPDAEAVRLDPGKALEAIDASGAVRVSRVAIGAVGSWRERRLVYAGASASDVVGDLARNLGVPVTLDAVVAPFTGTISLDGEEDMVVARAASLLGVRAERRDGGWLLSRDVRARP